MSDNILSEGESGWSLSAWINITYIDNTHKISLILAIEGREVHVFITLRKCVKLNCQHS